MGSLEPEAVVKDFVIKVFDSDDTVYVGIDPGADGAIAFLSGRRQAVIDIPVLKVAVTRTRAVKKPKEGGPRTRTARGESTVFNNPAIVAVFRALRPLKDRIVVALEESQVQVGGGVGRNSKMSAAKTAYSFAMWPLFFAQLGYPLEVVRPSLWKPAMGLGGIPKTGNDHRDAKLRKEASRALALKLFPRADIARVKDHDRAEALLIAEYVRRRRTGDLGPKKRRRR